ncbi:NfeD family protein [Paracoccus sp. p4-l81]|uniref:NfeD family protein n=1 Tax=unclassified Paracoccus (in: a-proteobacteria) TaxID=2688777 RepID=UPI0035BA666E
MIWQSPWAWAVAALVLAGLEIILPGWILLGFAIGAGVVAALIGTGVLGAGLPMALVAFGLASLVAWWLLRRSMGARGEARIWHRDINDN